MAEWLPLAEAGDATAQNSVGALYDHGLGVDEDDAEAARWYQLAADQNLPLAMRNLANMYASGHGVAFDKSQAEYWYEKAASLGDPVAIKRLGGLSPSGAPAAEASAVEPMTVAAEAEPESVAPVQTAEPGAFAEPTPAPEAAAAEELTEPTAEITTFEAAATATGDADTGEAAQYGDAGSTVSGGTANVPSAMTQQASVTPPPAAADPSNWLIGMWQGPSLGCPPGGGLEFLPGETRSYYQGRIAATLKAKYQVSGDLVTVVTTGVDDVERAYQYQRTGPEAFAIAAVPAEMPQSMIGTEHRRCASAPLAAAAAPAPSAQPVVAVEPAQPAAVAAPAPAQSAAPAPQQQAAVVAPQTTQPAATAPKAVTPGSPQAGWDAFGRGDYAGALAVWQPLAEQGDVAMQLLVGSIYDYGQGVPQDDAEAVKWYEMAANRGSAKGQYQAGAVYARSAQIKDPVQGYKWLTIAARTLSSGPQAGITADQATTLRTLLEAEMTEAEIANAKREAEAFKATKG